VRLQLEKTSQHGKVKNIDDGASKGSHFPKHRRCVVLEGGLNKPSPKHKRGGQKIILVEEIEVIQRDSKKMDKFEDGNNEDSSRSNNRRAKGGEEGEHHSKMTNEERSLRAPKVLEKKEQLARGGKKPIAK